MDDEGKKMSISEVLTNTVGKHSVVYNLLTRLQMVQMVECSTKYMFGVFMFINNIIILLKITNQIGPYYTMIAIV
jgi:hypothetical protein